MHFNTNNKVILVGYSSHALVVAEAMMLSGYRIIGYLDKERSITNLLKLEYLGFDHDEAVLKKIKGDKVFIAIGDNQTRESISTFMEINGFDFSLAIHPDANVSKYATIGKGTLVARGANINPFAAIGKGVIINTGAIIEHECLIDDFANISPGAVLAGKVKVGKGSFIGANAIVKQGVEIGKNVIVGAGAVILKEVPDNLIMVGNPAKRMIK
ncbi:MAG: acetyltransferase [Bacteroidota bacterium]|nr:acetyltransferase [Bacteroidota bacterium]